MASRIVPFLRSLLRFRLRTLLLAVLVISVGMAWYVNRVKRQQESIAAVKRLGGWTYYDYEVGENGQYDPEGESWAPAWLRKVLPDDYLHAIVHVNMVYNDDRGGRIDNKQMTDEVLSHLDGLPKVEMLLLHGSQASDNGLAHLGRLASLRKLYIWDTPGVTDVGVAHLAGCRKLEYVHLSGSQLSDDSARVFAQLPRLKGLSLQGNNLTDAGCEHLGKMTQLESLWIGCVDERRSKIGDAGVAHLWNLTNLDTLEIQHSEVTNEGLMHLTKLTKLRSLILNSSAVDDPSALKKALPQCQIDCSPPHPPFDSHGAIR
jgi:Leucine Rich Repeat (LRR) protein